MEICDWLDLQTAYLGKKVLNFSSSIFWRGLSFFSPFSHLFPPFFQFVSHPQRHCGSVFFPFSFHYFHQLFSININFTLLLLLFSPLLFTHWLIFQMLLFSFSNSSPLPLLLVLPLSFMNLQLVNFMWLLMNTVLSLVEIKLFHLLNIYCRSIVGSMFSSS